MAKKYKLRENSPQIFTSKLFLLFLYFLVKIFFFPLSLQLLIALIDTIFESPTERINRQNDTECADISLWFHIETLRNFPNAARHFQSNGKFWLEESATSTNGKFSDLNVGKINFLKLLNIFSSTRCRQWLGRWRCRVSVCSHSHKNIHYDVLKASAVVCMFY